MRQKIYDSIVFKLILAVVVIFITMLLVSMYFINRKQAMVIDGMIEDINSSLPSMSESFVLFIDSSKIQSSSDFTLYLILLMGIVLIVGSIFFAFIIKRILAPLKNLQKKIGEVDINEPDTFENIVIFDNTSSEIVELSQAFDKMLKKIYADYKRQRDFSSNVAHELRTPIAVMKSQLDLYRQKTCDPEVLNLLRVLDTNVNRLSSLVDAILSLRKKEKLRPSYVNIDDLIDEIIFDLEDKALDKGVQIKTEFKNISIKTDDSLLQRLIFNIIDNAIKYNVKDGRVLVVARDLGDMVEIQVSDTGIGISDADKGRIFDLFYQIDSSRRQDGFGIGLSLSKTIADMLGANVEIHSNESQGSTFIIKIPKTL